MKREVPYALMLTCDRCGETEKKDWKHDRWEKGWRDYDPETNRIEAGIEKAGVWTLCPDCSGELAKLVYRFMGMGKL